MRKLFTSLQLICLIATSINAGLLLYISIFIYRDPFGYLAVSGNDIQNKIYSYSFPVGLVSFMVSLILYFSFRKKYHLNFYLLIIPTIILSIYFLYGTLLFTSNYYGSSERLERAWKNNDSTYVKGYILSLKDDNVEEMTVKTYYVLSANTNFDYGMLYYTDNGWENVTIEEKAILKYNIFTVWKEYTQSKLFMNKKCRVNFQEIFWSDKKFNDYEINQIQQILNVSADSCEKNPNAN